MKTNLDKLIMVYVKPNVTVSKCDSNLLDPNILIDECKNEFVSAFLMKSGNFAVVVSYDLKAEDLKFQANFLFKTLI